jgi:hypothetical protein
MAPNETVEAHMGQEQRRVLLSQISSRQVQVAQHQGQEVILVEEALWTP